MGSAYYVFAATVEMWNSFVPLFGVLSGQLAQQFPVPSSSTAATSTYSEAQSEIDKVKIHRPSGEEFLA
jgi:hypothetical protein